MTGVPAFRSPPRTTVTRPSVAPVSTSTDLSSFPTSVHTCGGASSAERSRRCCPGGRGSNLNPPPGAGCVLAGGVKRSAVFGTSTASVTCVTVISAVAVIPGCSRRSELST